MMMFETYEDAIRELRKAARSSLAQKPFYDAAKHLEQLKLLDNDARPRCEQGDHPVCSDCGMCGSWNELCEECWPI